MRAPPELVTETSGTPRSAARVARPRELLADDAAHRAAHEREVHDRELALPALDRGLADHDRVGEPRRHLGLGEPLGVGAEVEEARGGPRSAGRPPPRRRSPRRRAPRCGPAPASGNDGRTAGRPRAPARARRRGSASDSSGRYSGASAAGARLVVGFDRNVDLGHGASLDRSPPPGVARRS